MPLCARLIPKSDREVYRRIHHQWEGQFFRELFSSAPDAGELAFLEFLLSGMERTLPFVKEKEAAKA